MDLKSFIKSYLQHVSHFFPAVQFNKPAHPTSAYCFTHGEINVRLLRAWFEALFFMLQSLWAKYDVRHMPYLTPEF